MKFIKKFIKWMVVAFFGSTILAVVILRFLPVFFTPLMFIRMYEQLQEGQELKLSHSWVSLEKMSPSMPVAVMASEDQRFLQHHGFDYEAIEKAAMHNMESKRIYFTVLIEFVWSKQRIMEVYLNSIEMGDGIYGVEAVAKEHFGCKASELTRSDCALIAATLPNPRKFSSKNPSNYMVKRKVKIMKEMRFIPLFPKEGQDVDPRTVDGGIYKK